MKVKELMTAEPLTAEVPGTRNEVLRMLVKHAVSGMPVVKAKSEELVGVITRSDIFRQPEEEQIALIMTSDPITVTPDEDVATAARIFFEERIHGLPVVDDGKLVGVISPTDILRVITEHDGEPVMDYITEKCTPIHQGTPLPVVWEVMNVAGQNALPVLDDLGQLTGMVVDSDLFKLSNVEESVGKRELGLADEEDAWMWDSLRSIMPLYYAKSRVDLPKTEVHETMVRDVVTVFQKTGISEAAKKMIKHSINQLPVIDANDKLVGVITDLDLMQAEMGGE